MERARSAAPRRVLVVYSHPRDNSLSHAFKESLLKGLRRHDAEVRVRDLYRERFDPLLWDIEENDLEPVTIALKRDVTWADWLVFVSPMWWTSVPAMLKGFFDRVFTEKYAFRYTPAGIPEGLLGPRRAFLIATSDTPPIVLRLAGRRGGFQSLVRGVLKLCGIVSARFRIFGSVLTSSPERRRRWIAEVERIGERIAGPETAAARAARAFTALAGASRPPLYSFVFFPVLLGASVAARAGSRFHAAGFALAALIGLLAHAAVSLSNEAADQEIDRGNANRTPFSGGTGLAAKGAIDGRTLRLGWIFTALLAWLTAAAMVLLFGAHWLLVVSVSVALFAGLEYSLPPLRLSRVGLGEASAFVGYGVPSMATGFLLQGPSPAVIGRVATDGRLLLALAVALGVTTTLCLTQIPDTEADRSNGKKSVSVLLGPAAVLRLSLLLLLLSVLAIGGLVPLHILPPGYALAACALPVWTGVQIAAHPEATRKPAGMKMVNIIGLSVTSAVFTALVPALYFLVG